ncbi:MAG TPA: DinB family protein [Candidatus Limnocylindria bacterium]|nr:DinB family protein [Candidatus Limnocylindria bacterium]
MSLTVVDNPADRPEWIRETIRLVTGVAADGRRSLLHLVEETTDADLLAGTPDDWGLGQIAVHLLIVDRGVSLIALRLARGEEAANTGQPRPAAGAVTRDGIRSLAEKADAVAERLRAEFPAEPKVSRTAAHPFYGPLNCFGWLLTIPNHYHAHLSAYREGRRSPL